MEYMHKYAFLDRDGTIIFEPTRPEGIDPRETFPLQSMEEFRFMEGDRRLEGTSDLGVRFIKIETNKRFTVPEDL